jgi:glyoxylase-like metal-dependent hydrolase (beta-lactamase superfamily II)
VIEFTDGEHVPFPSVTVRVVNGHTSALQCPVISDGKTTLFYCADLMPTTTHINLPWIMAYDLRPLITLEEKRRILNEAVDENWILFFEHDPATEAVRLMRTEKGIAVRSTVAIG